MTNIADALAARAADHQAERRADAEAAYRRLLTKTLDGPLSPQDLDELAGVVAVLGLAARDVDLDAKALAEVTRLDLQVEELAVAADAARKRLVKLRDEEAELSARLTEVRGQIDAAGQPIRETAKARDKARTRRHERPRLFSDPA